MITIGEENRTWDTNLSCAVLFIERILCLKVTLWAQVLFENGSFTGSL